MKIHLLPSLALPSMWVSPPIATSSTAPTRTQVDIVVLGCLIGLCVLALLMIVAICIFKGRNGVHAWLQKARERFTRRVATHTGPRPYENQATALPLPPIELQMLRPAAIANPGGSRGDKGLRRNSGWDYYHLARRQEIEAQFDDASHTRWPSLSANDVGARFHVEEVHHAPEAREVSEYGAVGG